MLTLISQVKSARIAFLSFIFLVFTVCSAFAESKNRILSFEFYEGTINIELDSSMIVEFNNHVNELSIQAFYNSLSSAKSEPVIAALKSYKEKHQLNDWLYYQLIRKTAQQISPKAENYPRYTLYKWFFLSKSGYDARLALTNDQILFYVRSEEDIYDIPYYETDGKQYVCLNFHDYPQLNYEKDEIRLINITYPESKTLFSYKISRMPDFRPESYSEKLLKFNYRQKEYHFNVLLNPEVETIFKNYPGVSFESYFNIPLSRETYGSLIPILRKNISGMSQKKGVDYLMRFTRYAFLYKPDELNFGKEKRLSPEQTLFNDQSDCDDRAALFFYLVKEIYNLPMIALLYPTHITMAVQFNKPLANSITYKGKKYSICEPTPQSEDLKIGQIDTKLKNAAFKVVYRYDPVYSFDK
ncbi:hypothetical protein [Daejeonella oryzae]|uniref:hypothetical protein n=1 Tax=Daejeonella oryzae TaxID=1122943 RepID=UPI000686BE2F|nr:hypothetical protein [Daejeonella oryzae]